MTLRQGLVLAIGLGVAACSYTPISRNAQLLPTAVLSPDKAPFNHIHILHVFGGLYAGDGDGPRAALRLFNGAFYGTTAWGGTVPDPENSGFGTVFKITPDGTETVLHSFSDSPDGAYPFGDLTFVNGAFYGTTNRGGAHNLGTVFRMSPSGDETVLYSFKGSPDGAYPDAGLVWFNGFLYGTTTYGGADSHCDFSGYGGCGIVYKITTSGTETVIHSFSGNPDGKYPYAKLTQFGQALYGTTHDGGAYGLGTVYRIANGAERVLHSFKGRRDDGAAPIASLIPFGNRLYGVTSAGGATHCIRDGGGNLMCGTVFSITATGQETLLYRFSTGCQPAFCAGDEPDAALTVMGGKLYGTTYGGGSCQGGTIFRVNTTGGVKRLHNFGCYVVGYYAGGGHPEAPMTALNGTLYGSTLRACSGTCVGTIFAFKPRK